MKYLKKFELSDFSYSQAEVSKWMINNKIYDITFDVPFRERTGWYITRIFYKEGMGSIYSVPYRDDGSWSENGGTSKELGSFTWDVDTWQEIRIYLESLSKEEIDELKAKQEADKFGL